MKNISYKLTLALLSFIYMSLLCSSSLACSYRASPVGTYDPAAKVVMIGKVIGYSVRVPILDRAGTKAHDGGGSWHDAQGYTIEVKETLPGGLRASKTVDVFEFFRTGACEPLGVVEPFISRRYPIGSEVAVIASEAKNVPAGDPQLSGTRFEIRPPFDRITSLSYIPREARPTLTSVFDYTYELPDPAFGMVTVEILKDIRRMELAHDINEKKTILERMSKLKDGWRLIDYYYLVMSQFPGHLATEEFYVDLLMNTGLDKKRLNQHMKCLEENYKGHKLTANKLRC